MELSCSRRDASAAETSTDGQTGCHFSGTLCTKGTVSLPLRIHKVLLGGIHDAITSMPIYPKPLDIEMHHILHSEGFFLICEKFTSDKKIPRGHVKIV